jgi:hypothetical protein
MKALIDECAPKALKKYLTNQGHECLTVQESGWSGKQNGEFLSLAEAAFDVLVTLETEPPLPTKLGQPQNRHCDSPVILESTGPPPGTLSGLRFGPRENQARGNRSRRQYELKPAPAANSDAQNADLPRVRHRNQSVLLPRQTAARSR